MMITTVDKDGNSVTVIRGGHTCKATRNMSFIEIWYEKNGKPEWIRILPKDMKKMLEELPDYKAKNVVEIIMEYDEEYTREMAQRDMARLFGRETIDKEIQSTLMDFMKNFADGDTK